MNPTTKRLIDANELRSKAYSAMLEIANTPLPNEYSSKLALKMGEMFQKLIDDAPTVEVEPVRRGCEYCSGRRTEYYHTTNTKLYINTLGNAQALETECNPCPPYSNCSLRGIPVRSAFIINYCPNCGAKMDGKECVPRKCGTCSNDGWDMPQCRECNEANGFKWYKRKMDAEVGG